MSTQLVADSPVEEPEGAPAGSGGRPAVPWAALGVALVVLVGTGLRLYSPSALWLDEAISSSISGLPLRAVPGALRQDGAPPLYALLLWGWERVVGHSPTQIRWLSSVFGIATLPAAAAAGARLAGRRGAVAALLLLASSPFAIYYSTEARMYSLLMLLVLGGFLALDGYLRRPAPARGVLLSVLSAALALTHYWALFLLAVVGAGLLVEARRRRRATCAMAAAWLAGGGLLFLPWLPTFLFQLRHTGTPWTRPPGFTALSITLTDWTGGGGRTVGLLLASLLLLLVVIGATAVAVSGWRLELDLRGHPPGRSLAVVVGGTLVLALAAGRVTGGAFAARYTSVVLPLFLLLAAVGVTRLPRAVLTPVLVVAAVTGVTSVVPRLYFDRKTEAPVLAEALRAQALPGDVVVYCPDQLGPDTSRLLPAALRQEAYPTAGSPERVNWVDYEQRNLRADPVAYARRLSVRAGAHAVWLVSAGGYRTYQGQCEALADTLTALRGQPQQLVAPDPVFFEAAQLRGWAPVGTGQG